MLQRRHCARDCARVPLSHRNTFLRPKNTACEHCRYLSTPAYPMASHVPFLAVRPDEQFSTEIKTRDFANSLLNPGPAIMDAPEAPSALPRPPAVSRLPAFVRFPFVCIISFSLHAFLYTVTRDVAGFELAAVSRDATDDWQVATIVGWKVVALAGAFYAGYDCTRAMATETRDGLLTIT